MSQTQDRVRVVSPGGNFIRLCTHREAQRLVQNRVARIGRANHKRIRSIIDLNASVDAMIPGNALMTTYDEWLMDVFSTITLKRVTPDGRLVKWDQGLTFPELRAGRFLSAATKKRLDEEKALKRVA